MKHGAYNMNHKQKGQSAEWRDTNPPASKKSCAQPSQAKTMLITFINYRGAGHKELFHKVKT
jgi:hypothetical protein